MRSMLSGEGFYSCSILFQLIHDRYVKMLLDTNGGFAPEPDVPPSQLLTRDGLQRGCPEMQRDAASSCRSRPRRCYGSGLAAGEDILLDDCVDAPISIHHLGDAEVDANRNQRDRLILGQLLGCHQKFAHLAERIAQSKVNR